MEPVLQNARTFEDVLATPSNQSRYDFKSIFQPEGMFGKRREKTRFQLLRALDERIGATLEAGEVVRMVSYGVENSLIEQMFLGWAVYYMNLTAFVLTDRRLLLFQINARRKPKTFIKQYRFNVIQSVELSIGRSLKVIGADGRTTAFARLPGKDGKRLMALLRESARPTTGERVGRENLCPACRVAIAGIPDACPSCGQGFKSPRKAGLLSLLFPGAGDLYLGHYGFAAFELGVGCLFWMTFMLDFTDPALAPSLSPAGAFVATAMLLVPFFHLPDAIATWRIGTKGLVPRKGGTASVVMSPAGMKVRGVNEMLK